MKHRKNNNELIIIIIISMQTNKCNQFNWLSLSNWLQFERVLRWKDAIRWNLNRFNGFWLLFIYEIEYRPIAIHNHWTTSELFQDLPIALYRNSGYGQLVAIKQSQTVYHSDFNLLLLFACEWYLIQWLRFPLALGKCPYFVFAYISPSNVEYISAFIGANLWPFVFGKSHLTNQRYLIL